MPVPGNDLETVRLRYSALFVFSAIGKITHIKAYFTDSQISYPVSPKFACWVGYSTSKRAVWINRAKLRLWDALL
ncbi:hypothetical protein GGR06_004022 [Bacteroides reticulotermitis]|uniref:Uncharacterized protein n=1 Tax=Bacteroides reticulotermitis TaxID=1133319 RepID=A0A840D5E5_9BACE|nr:hypothetical protein [Bacteroides reticulotermitis]